MQAVWFILILGMHKGDVYPLLIKDGGQKIMSNL